MKTRRGFFAAIAGAVVAPLAIKLFPKREPAPLTAKQLIENAVRILNSAPPVKEDPIDSLNAMLDQWNQNPRTITADTQTITITEFIPISDAEKRYGYRFYPEPIGMKIWPDPPVYPMRFQGSWEAWRNSLINPNINIWDNAKEPKETLS